MAIAFAVGDEKRYLMFKTARLYNLRPIRPIRQALRCIVWSYQKGIAVEDFDEVSRYRREPIERFKNVGLLDTQRREEVVLKVTIKDDIHSSQLRESFVGRTSTLIQVDRNRI